ncbi:hypothetical protein [Olsenella sp. HMSC062G07]|nr:hypothetical protein [Olsenella sp. HMSC062G07]
MTRHGLKLVVTVVGLVLAAFILALSVTVMTTPFGLIQEPDAVLVPF